MLDADSVKWFEENGGMKRENGDHFRNTLLSHGGSRDAMELFRDFRGADPIGRAAAGAPGIELTGNSRSGNVTLAHQLSDPLEQKDAQDNHCDAQQYEYGALPFEKRLARDTRLRSRTVFQ